MRLKTHINKILRLSLCLFVWLVSFPLWGAVADLQESVRRDVSTIVELSIKDPTLFAVQVIPENKPKQQKTSLPGLDQEIEQIIDMVGFNVTVYLAKSISAPIRQKIEEDIRNAKLLDADQDSLTISTREFVVPKVDNKTIGDIKVALQTQPSFKLEADLKSPELSFWQQYGTMIAIAGLGGLFFVITLILIFVIQGLGGKIGAEIKQAALTSSSTRSGGEAITPNSNLPASINKESDASSAGIHDVHVALDPSKQLSTYLEFFSPMIETWIGEQRGHIKMRVLANLLAQEDWQRFNKGLPIFLNEWVQKTLQTPESVTQAEYNQTIYEINQEILYLKSFQTLTPRHLFSFLNLLGAQTIKRVFYELNPEEQALLLNNLPEDQYQMVMKDMNSDLRQQIIEFPQTTTDTVILQNLVAKLKSKIDFSQEVANIKKSEQHTGLWRTINFIAKLSYREERQFFDDLSKRANTRLRNQILSRYPSLVFVDLINVASLKPVILRMQLQQVAQILYYEPTMSFIKPVLSVNQMSIINYELDILNRQQTENKLPDKQVFENALDQLKSIINHLYLQDATKFYNQVFSTDDIITEPTVRMAS